MHLENPQKASTFEPDQIGICLNSLDSEPKPECMRNTSVTSYLQMMRPLQLTLRRTFRGFWTAFQKLVDTLDLPSAWQKHRPWGKTLRRYHRSLFTTAKLTKPVWSNNKLSDHTKVNVYKACVISILLYGSESWTMRAHHEKRLNVFHREVLS